MSAKIKGEVIEYSQRFSLPLEMIYLTATGILAILF